MEKYGTPDECVQCGTTKNLHYCPENPADKRCVRCLHEYYVEEKERIGDLACELEIELKELGFVFTPWLES